MAKSKQFVFFKAVFILVFFPCLLVAQRFSVEVNLVNQPSGTVVFGSVKGDDFARIDSVSVSGPTTKVKFVFPENSHAGIYRILLGRTGYEMVMNKPARNFDFIFDNENLVFETDFEAVEERLTVVQSKENQAWYSFRKKDRALMKQISELETEIDNARNTTDSVRINDLANKYNQAQMERDMFVMKASQDARGLFVSQVIKNQRLPMLDGFLTPDERLNTFKADFFKVLDFSAPELINSSVYTDNVFTYLVRYNSPFITQKQRESDYIKAVDMIMASVKQNNDVRKFIKNYLLHGFEVLKMQSLINYINKKYPQ